MIKLLVLTLFPLILFSSFVEDEYTFEDGEAIYMRTCISCHGVNGETNDAMQLVVKPRKLQKTILTQAQSFKIIKKGAHFWGARADMMPSFGYVLNDEEINAVAFYISKKFNPDREAKIKKLLYESKTKEISEEKALKVGAKIFKRNCSLCHGETGNGESPYVEQSKANKQFIYPYNLTRTLLSEDQIFLYAKHGGHFWGTDKTDMPSWKKKYSDEELKSVAKYIHQKIKQIKD